MARVDITEDLEDHFLWDRMEAYFEDFDGVERLVRHVTVFDDGVVRDGYFDEGPKVFVRLSDNPEDPAGIGARPWSTIETGYNDAGQVDLRVIWYDNGVVREDTFNDGRPSFIRQSDNPQAASDIGAKFWTTIETGYDAYGRIDQKVVVFDDGTVREDFYAAGRRSLVRLSDNPQDPDGPGAKAWKTIEIGYGANGEIEWTDRLNDDGITTQAL